MDLVRALGMPFQLASVFFVAISAPLIAYFTSLGPGFIVLGLFALWLMLCWLTQYAFRLIDDIANGAREPAVASVEMLNPFHDARAWTHPLLAAALSLALWLRPGIPLEPVLTVVALLFPASIGAVAMSGRALDALNPLAMARVARGLALYYLLAVLFTVACAASGLWLMRSGLWSAAQIAGVEFLLMLVYAFIGGALYHRRIELGFAPRQSPERIDEQQRQQRERLRQQMIDGLYRDLRVREHARAIASATQWLRTANSAELHADVKALLQAAANWGEPRALAQFLRGLIPALLAMKQPTLAMQAIESALAAVPTFAPGTEADALAMIQQALYAGRKRTARTLLDNYVASIGSAPASAGIAALRERLG
jgi:hypothetical protein